MSVNSLLFKNSLELNAKSINLSGIASGLIKVAPIVTTSNILCANLYVERAKFCDAAGNIAVPSGPFTITNAPILGYVLTGINSSNASWQELPPQEPAQYLQTDTTAVKIYGSNAPNAGDVLIALSSTEAEWGPQSGGGSNVASFLDTTGAPVNVSLSGPPSINQVLKATSATTAVWGNVIATNAAYANVAGYAISALHSQWSDDANIALTALTANVAIFALDALHSDWADVANVAVIATNAVNADHAEWADFANLSAFAIDSTHTDWADFANSIANTTVTPGVYGDATHVGKFTVNASGQLTQAANVAISFPPAGNLTGPVTSVGLATTIASTGVSAQKYGNATNVPSFIVNAAGQLTQAANVAISFPPAGNLTGPVTSVGLATTIASTGVSAQKYGNATNVPSFIVNAAGQLTQAGNVAISFPAAGNLTGPITSVGLATSIASQTGTGSTFVVQTDPVITNPSFSQITNTGVLTLPTTTDTLTGRSTTDTLTNKTLTDNSNNILSRGLWQASGASSVSTYAATAGVTGQVLTMNSLTTANWQTPASGGQLTFSDSTFAIYDVTDNTKQIQFDAVGTTSTKTTITSSQTVDRILTLPDLTDTLVGRNTTDTLTNKTLTTPVISSIVNTGTLTLPSVTTTLVGRSTTDTLTNKTLTAPVISSIVNTGTLTLPITTDTLIGRATTDTLTNKILTDNSNNVIARGLWQNSGASSVSTYAATPGTTGQVLAMTSLTTAGWTTPSSGGQLTFSDSTFAIYDVTDNTKQIQFDAVGTTSTKTTITSSQTANRVLTLPDVTDTVAVLTSAQTLTNKTVTDNTNNVISRGLWCGSGTGSVSVYAAAQPTTGQILTALTSTTAAWSSPTSFAGTAVTSYTTAGSYTWTINANTKYVVVFAWGGGAGGGSGRRSTAINIGGGCGGGSGGLTMTQGPVEVFGTVNTGYTVVVGAGGAGGAAIAAGVVNGNAGTGGGNTTLNGIILATGGTGGYGGNSSFAGYPPAGTGYLTKQPDTAGTGDVVVPPAAPSAFGLMMTTGGGGGGGLYTGSIAYAGAKGGNVLDITGAIYLNGGNGGAVGVNGSAGNTFWTANQTFVGGTGGGGGGGRNGGTAGTGGAGGKPGGGGGGGGGSLNGTSGAGGAGADGAVYIIEYQTAPVTYNAQHTYDAAARATASATFVDIGAAMSVTLDTSTLVLVNISTYVTNNTINGGGYLSFTVSGATTIAAGNKYQTFNQIGTANHANQCTGSWVVPVTAGSNTFTLKFATFTGTSTFYYNHISVVPLN